MKKIKNNWKKILCATLAILAIVGCAAGVTAFVKKDSKKISASAFDRGDLDSNGKFITSDTSLVTKEPFECIGLRVDPDFTFEGTYDVFYYDYDKRFIEAKLGLTGVYDEDYPLAQLARIVIHPDKPEDADNDWKIKFYEEGKYARDLKITVDKNQDRKYETFNLYDDSKATVGKTFFATPGSAVVGAVVELTDDETMKVSEKIKISSEFEYYDVFVQVNDVADLYAIGVIATSDNVVSCVKTHNLGAMNDGEWCKITLTVEDVERADYLQVRMPKDASCHIYGYNK